MKRHGLAIGRLWLINNSIVDFVGSCAIKGDRYHDFTDIHRPHRIGIDDKTNEIYLAAPIPRGDMADSYGWQSADDKLRPIISVDETRVIFTTQFPKLALFNGPGADFELNLANINKAINLTKERRENSIIFEGKHYNIMETT